MQDVLGQLVAGGTLSESEAARAFDEILHGRANESQVGALLALIASRGPTIEELVGGARAMRAHAMRVEVRDGAVRERLIDTCGTGGAPKTFNISTASAIIAAGARAPGGRRVHVAKHGGRSRSGRGSAEVLQALGVNIDAPVEVQARCLEEVGVCFSFAVNHHPAMRFAAGPRKSLGFPTIFNLLGPLTNPAGAPRQLMGVYDARYVGVIAEALARLGAERAMVVHGRDGMDEVTTTAPTIIAHVEGGRVRTEEFDAGELGIGRATLDDLRAGTLGEAAALIRAVLAGERGPALDIALVNAGAALVVGDAAPTMREGLELAREAVGRGEALRTLARLAELSHDSRT